MKVKKIILAIISTLILLAISMQSSVLATTPLPEATTANPLVLLNLDCTMDDEEDYSISNSQDVNSIKMHRIAKMTTGENYEKIKDAYCAWADKGFENRESESYSENSSHKDTYTARLNMVDNKTGIINNGLLNEPNGIIRDGVKKYDAILQLTNLFLLEEDNFEEYKNTILKEAIDESNGIVSTSYQVLKQKEEQGATNVLLNEKQIRAVQQAALWYFTSNGNDLYNKYSNRGDGSWLEIKEKDTPSCSIATIPSVESDPRNSGCYLGGEAQALYNYLIDTAIENAKLPNAQVNNNVYLYSNILEKESTQPILMIEKVNRNFDLALRKYISQVTAPSGNVTNYNAAGERMPNVDTTELKTNIDVTTATYKHRKDPVEVVTGSKVKYKLVIYNEGEVEGRATKVVDRLPEGLKFLRVVSGNFESDGTYSTTNNTLTLVRKAGNTTDLAAYTNQDIPANEEIEIECEVTATSENGKEKIYTNIAWIAEHASNKGTFTDRDSNRDDTDHTPSLPSSFVTDMPNVGYTNNDNHNLTDKDHYFKGQEDDDDFEKIKLVPGPEIHKGVKTVENQDSGYDKDEEHKWVINSTVPEDIANYTKYIITDDIDYRLKYIPNSVVVLKGTTSIPEDSPEMLAWTEDNKLTEGVDYILEYTPYTNNNDYSGNIKITFIDTENGRNATDKFKSYKGGFIVVRFYTTFAVDEETGKLKAELGTNIPNQAKLQYNNNGSGDKTKKTETPEVHTGGVSLFKYKDSDGHKIALAGAKFQIFDNENKAKTWFNDAEDEPGIAEATSDGNGLVTFTGLKYGGDAKDKEQLIDGTYVQDRENNLNNPENRLIPGTTYWIVETAVPEGYRSTLTAPIKVVIDKDSHQIAIDTQEQRDGLQDADVNADDNSGRAVKNAPKEFDLALRKFIVKVRDQNGNVKGTYNEAQNRVPDTTGNKDLTGEGLNPGERTAEKKHEKDPVTVKKGDRVIYTIRVYNEGEVDGYAKEVTDYLPEGLSFIEPGDNDNATHSKINKQYGWTKDSTGKVIKTEILKEDKISAVNREWSKLNDKDTNGKPIYYRDLQVECVVNSDANSKNLRNIAEITSSKGENETPDKDSTTGSVTPSDYKPTRPKEGRGEEDDDDFEDLKLNFDLALRKYITKVERNGQEVEINNRTPDIDESTISVTTGDMPTTATYKHRKDPVLVQNGDIIYYTLTVYNEGDVNGHAKEIMDQLPKYLTAIGYDSETFEATENDYSRSTNTIRFTRKISDENPQKAYEEGKLADYSESVTVKCRLNYEGEEEETKIFTNIAWISKYYSEDKGEVEVDLDSQATKPLTTMPKAEDLVTPGIGYTGKDNYTEEQLKDSTKYYKGQQDEDDFEKIKIVGGPEIHKGVKTVENQDSGYDFGLYTEEELDKKKEEEHLWVINSTIPEEMSNYRKYVMVDDIDDRLEFLGTKTVKVSIIDGENEIPLEEGADKDYILVYDDTAKHSDILGVDCCGTLKVIFVNNEIATTDGEYKATVSNKLTANEGKKIKVTYNTTFALENGEIKAKLGTNVPNRVTLNYKNGSNTEKTKYSEKPEVHTGGVSLFKYTNKNGEKVGLEGAEFTIYATEEDATNKTNPIATATSGENGLVTFAGLKYGGDAKDSDENYRATDGTYVQDRDGDNVKEPEERVIPPTKYYIAETKEPTNYKPYSGIIEVEIDANSYETKIAQIPEARQVENMPEVLDLALRKFITRVANNPEMEDATEYRRAPTPTNLENLYATTYNLEIDEKDKVTTATYNHTKQPVKVKVGDFVEYTLRVYNEGSTDAYAIEITDHLPEYLEYVDCEANKTKYKWVVDQSDSTGRTIKTDYLNDTKLDALELRTMVGGLGNDLTTYLLDSTEKMVTETENNELKIICKVKDTIPYGENQTNIAEITKYGDKTNTQKDEDRDSQTPDGDGGVKLPSVEELPDYKKSEIEENKPYIPGQQDDDDFEKIYVEKFDLALRKFITQVDGTQSRVITDRVPQVKYNKETKQLEYLHTKEPVLVVKDDVVTYTLRIFNEGNTDGFAKIITDDIPDGVEFLPEHLTNKNYLWKMYAELPEGTQAPEGKEVVELNINEDNKVKKYVETDDVSKAVIIRTDYLSYENGEKMKKEQNLDKNPNLLKAYDEEAGVTDTNPDYRDIKIAFKVVEPYRSKRIIINYAQISDDQDDEGKPVKDEDSTPDSWKPGEDDQDIEKIRVPEFDLALRKWVTQAIVTENGQTTITETGHQPFDDPEEVVKVELHRKKLSDVTVKFRYSIRVYNDGLDENGNVKPGYVAGYAKEVKDHIPEGLKFLQEDNPDWKDEGNNIITTTKLANTLLQPGEYADVEVVLTWINGADNLGLKINYAEISKDYNDWHAPDNDSTPDNMKEKHEDDDDEAPVILSITTGAEATYIILTLIVLTTLAGGIALIKKYVM